ncbi:MAG: glycosyltransferase family 2 protein [Kiritimatiellae bacterium]|nr:glycosyltransferase family 2 protein [Kiritimatiellia bacterium]
MADFSLILLSHNKPRLVREAVACVLAQTHADWEAVLIDSGVLYEQGFFRDVTDPRFRVVPSGETDELRRTKHMASWCFNRVLNDGGLTGELILYLCDDDLLYPEAMSTFRRVYLEHGRAPQAMYASQDIGVVDAEGNNRVIGQRLADRPGGRCCRGRRLDCRVDYLQFCHTAAILRRYREAYGTDEYHPEDKRHAYHADGIFMERIGALTAVHPVPEVLSMNRRTAESTNLEHATTALGRMWVALRSRARVSIGRNGYAKWRNPNSGSRFAGSDGSV